MTTHELAHLLLAHPDVRVLVDGYEGDEDDVGHICMGTCTLDSPLDNYSGQHCMQHGGVTPCVVIRRGIAPADARVHDVSCGVSTILYDNGPNVEPDP